MSARLMGRPSPGRRGAARPAARVGRMLTSRTKRADAATRGSRDVPAWVPDDATTIRVVFQAGQPGFLVSFGPAAGVRLSAACAAGPAEAPLEPTISASWWPETPLRADRRRCGGADVARTGDEWYVWGTGGPMPSPAVPQHG